MIKLLPIIWFILLGKNLFAQEKLNFTDENGRKQGHWIYFGKDRPESGISPDGKVEEGNYIDDRKEGTWIKYHDDGKTPKIKAEYVNNRPCGEYVKYWQTGAVRESGEFEKNTSLDSLKRGGGYYSTEYTYKWDGTPDTLAKSTSDKNVPLPLIPSNPNTRSTPFKPDGYNKVYNGDDEIWLDGQFRNSQLYDGKQYVYDRDGILIRVYIFKAGTYHSNGRL